MPKYIDAEKAAEYIKKYAIHAIAQGKKELDTVDDTVEIVSGLDLIPAADVRENKRGHWTRSGYIGCLKCSECGKGVFDAKYLEMQGWKYCPCCGANMRG